MHMRMAATLSREKWGMHIWILIKCRVRTVTMAIIAVISGSTRTEITSVHSVLSITRPHYYVSATGNVLFTRDSFFSDSQFCDIMMVPHHGHTFCITGLLGWGPTVIAHRYLHQQYVEPTVVLSVIALTLMWCHCNMYHSNAWHFYELVWWHSMQGPWTFMYTHRERFQGQTYSSINVGRHTNRL